MGKLSSRAASCRSWLVPGEQSRYDHLFVLIRTNHERSLPLTEMELGSGETPRREWHFQVSHASRLHPTNEPEWRTLFTIMEDEFFQADVEESSYAVSNMSHFIFYHTVICTRRISVSLERAEDKDEAALWGGVHGEAWVEKWNLEGDKVTHRVGGRLLEERTLKTERERLEVLRDVFGVGVTPEDEQWIQGRVPALPAMT